MAAEAEAGAIQIGAAECFAGNLISARPAYFPPASSLEVRSPLAASSAEALAIN